jgi:hypothetical protein
MPRNIREWTEFGQTPRPDEALKSGDLPAALAGFATQHFLDSRFRDRTSDGPAIGFGVSQWLLGDDFGAAMVWASVCETAYKGRYHYSSQGTFQGGLLLWFASVWLKDEDWHDQAEQLFDKLLRKKHWGIAGSFSGRLARFVRREIDLSEVEAGYSDEPLLRERRQTQALFYAGVRAFEAGDIQETERLWRQVGAPKNSLVELEYYLLVYERERLNKRG